MVSALDYEEGDPGSIPGRGRLSTDSAGIKLFHPYQVGTFVDYPC